MAATGANYQLQQQKGKCEAAIKNCINSDLKEICKAYNYQVSGTKAVLQKRCLEILETIVNNGDQAGYNDLLYRVSHHGQAPPRSGNAPSGSLSNYHNTNGHYHTASQMAPRGLGRNDGGKYFKVSPFYEVQEPIIALQDLPGSEMPQNRNTVRVNLTLSADQVSRLKADTNLRILLYCGMTYQMGGHPRPLIDVAFPNQIEVKINGDEVRHNFKGLKNKPGSTKPADITNSVRKANNYPNQVAITYALTKQRFSFIAYLVKYVSADHLTERIKAGRHGGGIISKQKVLDEMNRANADPDIAATSVRMSLKDPISTIRITLPVRSVVCKHNQCFDGKMFMALQEQAPQWSCPVCSKSVSYESLCIDKYFEEILQKTPSSIEKVDIEPNGEWRIIKEEEDTKPPGHSSKSGRASYDDDFDDDNDLIEVVDPKANGKPPAAARPTPSLLSPMPDQGYSMNTPPLSSRGVSVAPSAASASQSNKRPASSVIDLTLDDEDDQPPRSGKRQQTGTSIPQANTSQYSTPNSLPEHRYNPTYPAGQNRGTDSYRPSSTSARPLTNGRTSSGDYSSNNHLSSGVASGSGSPYRPPGSISPGFSANKNNSSTQHSGWGSHSRPATGHASSNPPAFQPFSVRPHAPSNSASQSPQQSYRLPPIVQPPAPHQQQQQQQNGYNGGGWRSDYSNHYSHSPPG